MLKLVMIFLTAAVKIDRLHLTVGQRHMDLQRMPFECYAGMFE